MAAVELQRQQRCTQELCQPGCDCKFTQKNCDDGNVNTADLCDPYEDYGCVYVKMRGPI